MKIRADKESRILQSAQRMFAGRGFCRSLMQIISNDASIAKANIHYNFCLKEKLYRRVVERIFTVWLEAADSFETSNKPRAKLQDYVSEKMEISHLYPDESKFWANEVINGVSIIDDFFTFALEARKNSRIEAMRRSTRQGKRRNLEPRVTLYMLWAAMQPYKDFAHQIETLNDGEALSINRWQQARDTVFRSYGQGLSLGIRG